MADVYDAKRASVLGVEVVPRQDTEKYGIVEVEADRSATSRVKSIVEKPKPEKAPSNLAVVGRYVLSPAIFEHLERIGHGAGGEIQLTDGIAALMGEEAVYAYRFSGKRYDCGSKLGYLQATVASAFRGTAPSARTSAATCRTSTSPRRPPAPSARARAARSSALFRAATP